MFTPSLTLAICLAAPLVAIWSAYREDAAQRPYFLAAVPLCLATTLAVSNFANTSFLSLATGQEIQIGLLPLIAMTTAISLAVFGLIVWLQKRFWALTYARFTRWLAAPLSLAAASTVLLSPALPYLSGVLKWAFAAPAIKALGVLGLLGLGLSAFAIFAFAIQLVLGLMRRKQDTP